MLDHWRRNVNEQDFSFCAHDRYNSPASVQPIPPVPASKHARLAYDHVYYDVNNSIYQLIGKSTNEEHFYIRLYNDIDSVMKRLKADKLQSLFLAVDGPGPRAKVSTQLSRRLKVEYEPNKPMQRLSFTPGTRFMERLRVALNVFAASRATTSRNVNFAVWVSGADCPGEGENKCFAHMRLVPPSHRCLVIGNDSDLIPYALQAECEVHIMRERSGQLINTKVLKEDLSRGILPDGLPQAVGQQRVADDFVFLAIFIGNDYVPGARYFFFDQAWEQYQSRKKANPSLRSTFLYDAKTMKVSHSCGLSTAHCSPKLLLARSTGSSCSRFRAIWVTRFL
jgi:5'-3' exonuclease